MNHIKTLRIIGFKKFSDITIEFNKNMNIIVGENESGKTTILEALKIVLNQQYKNADKAILKDLFNINEVEKFISNPDLKTLPKIVIEVELQLDSYRPDAIYFYGEVYGDRLGQPEKYGIRFECLFDMELSSIADEFIKKGIIPYEYYIMKWTTFANRPYNLIRRPLNFIAIDSTKGSTTSSFNYYNKTLFINLYDEVTRASVKNHFRSKLEEILDNTVLLKPISDNRKFGLDSKKIVLENILSVYEDSIPLENHGSGMENLIKTKIALDRVADLNVILIEEPENHLSPSTLQHMLQEIVRQKDESQIIITTHSNMIASRLNLKNIIWITQGRSQSLDQVDNQTSDFFVRADDNNFLQLLLSEKAFLVEGATEYLLLPKFYHIITGRTIEDDKVSIISCKGISFKRYLKIIQGMDKRVAVLTDNDNSQERIENANKFNDKYNTLHIFMDLDIDNWTWEVCMYKCNAVILDRLIKTKGSGRYIYKGRDVGKTLGKMLNNKVDSAYTMLTSNESFVIPKYIENAIKWLGMDDK